MCRTKNRSLRVEIIKFTFTDTRSFSITGHAKETSMFKHLWILTYLYAQTGAFQNVPNSSHRLLFDFWITEFTSRTILILLCSPSSSKAFFFFSAGRTFTVQTHGITMTFLDDTYHLWKKQFTCCKNKDWSYFQTLFWREVNRKTTKSSECYRDFAVVVESLKKN